MANRHTRHQRLKRRVYRAPNTNAKTTPYRHIRPKADAQERQEQREGTQAAYERANRIPLLALKSLWGFGAAQADRKMKPNTK